jgi:hypothetical protein
MASCTSPPASFKTLPISRVISRENLSLLRMRISPRRKRISARRGAGRRRQRSAAPFAACTASSTSSAPETGKRPTTSRVSAGFASSNHSPEAEATHSPPM